MNQGPADLQSAALATELCTRCLDGSSVVRHNALPVCVCLFWCGGARKGQPRTAACVKPSLSEDNNKRTAPVSHGATIHALSAWLASSTAGVGAYWLGPRKPLGRPGVSVTKRASGARRWLANARGLWPHWRSAPCCRGVADARAQTQASAYVSSVQRRPGLDPCQLPLPSV